MWNSVSQKINFNFFYLKGKAKAKQNKKIRKWREERDKKDHPSNGLLPRCCNEYN